MRRERGAWARGGRAGAVALFALCVVASGSWARVAYAESAEVESLIAHGNEMRRQGQADRALPLFLKAYGLVHTPRTAGQLGLAEVAVGDLVEAERHLGAALESPQNPWVASNRAGLEKMLARARAGIGELVIDGGPPGAGVAVNGRPAGALPLAAAIKVNAGRVDVEVTAPGHVPAARSLHVDAGEHQRLTVTLEKVTASSTALATAPIARSGGSTGPEGSTTPGRAASVERGTAAASPSAPPSDAASAPGASVGSAPITTSQQAASPDVQPPTSGLRTAAWVVAGGAVVGLGTGLGFQLAALGKSSDFNTSCDVVDNKIVAKTMTFSMQDCQSLLNTWNSEKRWSIVGYVTGAALAVTSGVLFWSSRPTSPAGDLRAHVTCAPGPGTFFCRGEF